MRNTKTKTKTKTKPSMRGKTGKLQPNGKFFKGFAAMTQEKRESIAAMGGKAVSKKYGRRHMSDLGVRGGLNSHANKLARATPLIATSANRKKGARK
jgi:general stress protein YciG